MMLKIHLIMLTALLACGAASLQAQTPREDSRNDRRAAQQERDNLDRAAGAVRRETGGRVLSADVEENNGDRNYRIKVLTPNGRVRTMKVDPHTGRPVE